VEKSDDTDMVNANMVPPLLEAVLIDYHRNVPDAREAEVLNVMTTIIHKLHVRSDHASFFSLSFPPHCSGSDVANKIL
jgi:exportin-1